MFLDFYGLREQPFGVTPDPRFLYFSAAHREALASLYYGIDMGRGFVGLIAQPGMGKTTLLFQLRACLKDSCHCAFLFQTQCDSRELLRYLLDALGLDGRDQDMVRMHARLNEFLLRETIAGRRIILIIDEAQNLSDQVLETVRLLTDFEASDRKLLHIVLAGQPELAHRLRRPESAQLRQRISVLSHLSPLAAVEVDQYVRHRLQVAGHKGPELFTPAAMAAIAESSYGIPRNINNICFNALSLGCATKCKRIRPELVAEAAGDLSPVRLFPPILHAPSDHAGEIPPPAGSSHQAFDQQQIEGTLAAHPAGVSDSAELSLGMADGIEPPTNPPQREILPQTGAPSSFHGMKEWFCGMSSNAWIARIALFSALSGCAGVYLGARAGKVEALSVSALPRATARRATYAQLDTQPTPILRAGSVSVANEAQAKPTTEEGGFPFYAYVTQPNAAFAPRSTSAFGHFDPAMLAAVQLLDPNLKTPTPLMSGPAANLSQGSPEEKSDSQQGGRVLQSGATGREH